MPLVLDTTVKIIRYVENLSTFIDNVTIVAVHDGGFSFKVKVPRWYKIIFSKILRKHIQKKLTEKIVPGVKFDFVFYSEDFF